MTGAGDLDTEVTIVKRVSGARDAGGQPATTWEDQVPSLWADRTDVKDGERLQAGGVAATLRVRFKVRAEDIGAANEKDRIRDEDTGELFEIVGIKRVDAAWREITAGVAA